MEKIFLLSALLLASLFSWSGLATTVSLNQYDRIQYAPVTVDRTVQEFKNQNAFAVLLNNGQLFSWGLTGRDSYTKIDVPVIPEGRSVKEIFSSGDAFTALLDDDTIVCGGGAGIRAPFIASERKVLKISSNAGGFVAILDNNTVVGWGHFGIPKSLRDLEDQGQQVVSVYSAYSAFAAVVENPATSQQTIISWGNSREDYEKGYTTAKECTTSLTNKVKSIAANDDAFVALLDNGHIKVWGNEYDGGADPHFSSDDEIRDKKIISLAATENAFTALFENGMIRSWGAWLNGGKTPMLPVGSTVQAIYATRTDFAALLSGGEHHGDIFYWGYFSKQDVDGKHIDCGNGKTVPVDHKPIKLITANASAFAAILQDDSVIAWGDPNSGGTIPSSMGGQKVKYITPCSGSFTAILDDQTIQSWGDFHFGGKTPMNMPVGSKVAALISDNDTYMALLEDGSLFSWGGTGRKACPDGQTISLPKATKALWLASPFEKHVLSASSSQ